MIQTSKAVWVWEHFGLQKWGWTCPWGEMIISQMAELSLKVKCQSLSRVQLCNSMDCRPPGSSVHGICQVTILEWVVIPFSRGSSLLRGWTRVSCIAGGLFTIWATREAQNWAGWILETATIMEAGQIKRDSLCWEISRLNFSTPLRILGGLASTTEFQEESALVSCWGMELTGEF